ncbi:MAG: sulfate adenylyltransferase subunit CysD [Deltaproteobacteria bacterium]|nr:sulfate adenylyltransferase subunit CysD [Deltaproteobacteria bacterium]
MNRLDALENETMFILREAAALVNPLGMLWSIGKDSTALLHIARKAFFGALPFPLIHVDTSFKIPEMILFRDRVVREWGCELLVIRNEKALATRETYPAGACDRIRCCVLLKTTPLRLAVTGRTQARRLNLQSGKYESARDLDPFGGLILGIRGDEEGTRSKERIFSIRAADGSWDISQQNLEPWGYFQSHVPSGGHVRVHPLLNWTELDIWEYLERERIEVVPLYFDQGNGTRYRSLGCAPCTQPIQSTASSVAEIVAELRDGALSRLSERAGRSQDSEDGGGLETLRRQGYM